MSDDSVTWDGKDFAAVQMLLTGTRQAGEPSCRLPGADMSRMQVLAGCTWLPVFPGQRIVLDDDGIWLEGKVVLSPRGLPS